MKKTHVGFKGKAESRGKAESERKVMQFFSSLADETRLHILLSIAENPKTVNEIYSFVGRNKMTLSAISHQLKHLNDLEIVTYKKVGSEKFFELFVNCPLSECVKKDTKGLYKKAAAGEIKDLIGFSESSPYEAPVDPDIEALTHQEGVDESVSKIMEFFKKNKLL